MAQIGHALVLLQPREILRAVFGSVPDGLLAALEWLGPDPLSGGGLYRKLFDLFSDRKNRAALSCSGKRPG